MMFRKPVCFFCGGRGCVACPPLIKDEPIVTLISPNEITYLARALSAEALDERLARHGAVNGRFLAETNQELALASEKITKSRLHLHSVEVEVD